MFALVSALLVLCVFIFMTGRALLGGLDYVSTAASDDQFIIINSGADVESRSFLPLEAHAAIKDALALRPGLVQAPPVSTVVLPAIVEVSDGREIETSLVGVSAQLHELANGYGLRILEGRNPTDLRREIAVTRALAARIGAGIPREVRIGKRPWLVVGVVDDTMSPARTVAYTTMSTLQDQFKLTGFINSEWVRLARNAQPQARAALRTIPNLQLALWSRQQYEAQFIGSTRSAVVVWWCLAVAVTAICALGGIAIMTAEGRQERGRIIATLSSMGWPPLGLRLSLGIHGMVVGAVAAALASCGWLAVMNGVVIDAFLPSGGLGITLNTTARQIVGDILAVSMLTGLVFISAG
ncbi:MAG: ABC transporter permease [Burkholderiales bacterium]